MICGTCNGTGQVYSQNRDRRPGQQSSEWKDQDCHVCNGSGSICDNCEHPLNLCQCHNPAEENNE